MEKLTTVQLATLVISLGFSVVFGLFIMAFLWKYGPEAIKTGRDLAIALQGLKDEVLQNRSTCQLVSGDLQKDVCSVETRLSGKLDEMKDIGVKTLKNVEEINTRLKVKQGAV